MEIRVFSDLAVLTRAAAEILRRTAYQATARNHRLTIALSGGLTPKGLYRLLASEEDNYRDSVAWQKLNFFWSDERCVPPDSDESNFKAAFDNLLRPLGISPMNYHRLKGELEPIAAAEEYEKLLRLFFNLGEKDVPRFDLVLLGMGADGHTASLFPGSEVLAETKKLVAAPRVEKLDAHRLTFTPNVIKNADQIIFLVAGADKARAFREVIEGEFQPEIYPAQIARVATGKLLFLTDEAAASLVSPETINRALLQDKKLTAL